MRRFHFEDNGQDVLWWDVETTEPGIGCVVDAGPFQQWVWASGECFVNLVEPHGVGDRLVYTNDLQRSKTEGYCLVFKHVVAQVERMTAMAGAA